MNSVQRSTDRKVILSTLWITVMLNMIYADILGFMDPGFLEGVLRGYAEDVQITQGLLLIAALVLEIPMAMVLLSRVLKYGANRRVNIIAGAITIAFVILGGSLALTYVFFATIEVACISLIIWYAWTWRDPQSSPDSMALEQAIPGGLS